MDKHSANLMEAYASIYENISEDVQQECDEEYDEYDDNYISENFDDVVYYLISEGYASDEDEAYYIMANMSEELIAEGILSLAKAAMKALKGGKATKALGSALKGLKGGKGAKSVPSLGKLGSGNVTTAGANLTPKAGSRAAQLKARYNVGPEGSDTSAKRQIIDKARARLDAAKADLELRDFGSPKTVDKSKDALDRYLKAGYSKYGADRPPVGRGNAANRRATQTNKPAGLTADEESRMRDLRKAIDKFGTPGYPGTNDPSIRRYQKEYIDLQRKQAGK